MRQEIIDLYDEFTHRGMDRRLFMQRLSELAGGTAAATAALSMLRSNYAKAAVIAPDDNRLKAGGSALPVRAVARSPPIWRNRPRVLTSAAA